MRPLFFIMSIAGSVLVLMYWFALRFFGNKMKARWRQILVRISLVFYLFPFAYFEFYPKSLYMDKIPAVRAWNDRRMAYIDLQKMFIITKLPLGRTVSKYELWYEIFGGVCILTAIIVFAIVLSRFLRCQRIFCCYSKDASQAEQQILERLKQQIHLKRKVNLAESEYITEPLTMGVITPTIIVPKYILESDCKEEILLHELTHIKHGDIVWRLLGLTAVALHWYNPICYLMNGLMYEVDENSSDETATESLARSEKLRYCEAMIKVLGSKKQAPVLYNAACFSGKGTNQMKRRIDEIMREKRKMKTCFASAFGVLMVLIGLSVGLIYTPPMISYADEKDPMAGKYDFEVIVMEKMENSILEADCDEFFVETDGTVILIRPGVDRAACDHAYVSAVKKKHTKNNDGGCTIKYYNTEVCKRCQSVRKKELSKTETYVVCPH